MDRKTWIFVGFSILGIVLWQWYYTVTYGPYLEHQRKESERVAAVAVANATPPPADVSATPGVTPAQAAELAPRPTPRATIQARRESISAADQADFLFNNDTGGIETAILLMHLGENKEAVGLNRDRQMPIGALSYEPGEAVGGFDMRTNKASGRVIFTKTEEDGLEIKKVFSVSGADAPGFPYVVQLEISFTNPSESVISRPGMYVSAGGAAPIHVKDMPIYTKFEWYREGKMHGIDVNWFDSWKIPLVGIETRAAKPVYEESSDNISWIAVTSQYFTTILSTDGEGSGGTRAWATRFDAALDQGHRTWGMQGALGFPGFELAPGATRQQQFQIYAGPKDLATLRQLGAGEEAVMNFGMFGFVSKFLLWAMNYLQSWLHSYAAAIILLTLLIKSALWPLQNKATNSMRKMAALSPKMAELREKYKDDPTKMNGELMKLYKDYGVNPFGGCLPMLIQIPIFFGFYAMLGSAIELRNSSFLWVVDLSQPDTIFRVGGFPINILPIVMAGSMVWQMAITPKTGDAMQQRILLLMPVIFLVFAYNYASALSLYWTTQNLFSIVQLYLTRNNPLPELQKRAVPAKKQAGPSTTSPKKRKKRQT
jgi:YidC/Oxa1 family membrane protein insertase